MALHTADGMTCCVWTLDDLAMARIDRSRIDWGDGTRQSFVWKRNGPRYETSCHRYASEGEFTVRVTDHLGSFSQRSDAGLHPGTLPRSELHAGIERAGQRLDLEHAARAQLGRQEPHDAELTRRGEERNAPRRPWADAC